MAQVASFSDVGIGGLPAIAQRMAEFGRNGDRFLGHLEQNDTVIPMAVLDANPALKESLFAHMRQMGVDPNRYIVGTNFNSINPDTGLPEFFLKDLFNGIKDVVKKAAPVVLPFALNAVFPGLGPVLSGAIGAGVGSLIGGASAGNALKAAAIGGAAGGIFSGLRAGFTGTEGTFGERFTEGVAQPFRDLGVPIPTAPEAPSAPNLLPVAPPQGTEMSIVPGANEQGPVQMAPAPPPPAPPPTQPGIIDRTIDFFTPKSGPSLAQSLEAVGVTDPSKASSAQLALAQDYMKANSPGLLRNYGPLVALGGIGAYAMGAFDQPKAQPPADFYSGQTGAGLLAASPDRYRLGLPALRRPQVTAMAPAYQQPGYPAFAAGGPAFPRRTGGISGPGTGTSDSIPAMLSDGEFVMTARAVRGAGNGSRKDGVRTMYELMRKFERNA